MWGETVQSYLKEVKESDASCTGHEYNAGERTDTAIYRRNQGKLTNNYAISYM